MNIPIPATDEELKEMRGLYDSGPERACLDELEYLRKENDRLAIELAADPITPEQLSNYRNALIELSVMVRTVDAKDFVHQLRCRGLLK